MTVVCGNLVNFVFISLGHWSIKCLKSYFILAMCMVVRLLHMPYKKWCYHGNIIQLKYDKWCVWVTWVCMVCHNPDNWISYIQSSIEHTKYSNRTHTYTRNTLIEQSFSIQDNRGPDNRESTVAKLICISFSTEMLPVEWCSCAIACI